MHISDWSSDVCFSDLVAAVPDLADDDQLIALLLVAADGLAETAKGLDGVELVPGFGVALAVLLDLAVLDDGLAGDEGEADAALRIIAEAGDVGSDAAREKNLVHVSVLRLPQRADPAGMNFKPKAV